MRLPKSLSLEEKSNILAYAVCVNIIKKCKKARIKTKTHEGGVLVEGIEDVVVMPFNDGVETLYGIQRINNTDKKLSYKAQEIVNTCIIEGML